jgi:signal transduction histidine kinase
MQPIPARIRINALLHTILGAAAFKRQERVRIERSFADDEPEIMADPDLLTIACENVIRNAIEAMPDGGVLLVKTEHKQGQVFVSFCDTGPGMDVRTLERCQEELFTTKAGGSGLGLAFVRRIMRAHKGAFAIHSVLGQGTEVRLSLPIPTTDTATPS